MLKRMLFAALALALSLRGPAFAVDLGVAKGGGGPAYVSGSEIGHADLAGGTLTFAASDLKKTHLIFSSAEGGIVFLPAANASGVVAASASTPATCVGFRVPFLSKPIRVENAGTAGNDAILEGYALPGAEFAICPYSTASAAGDWRTMGTSRGLFNGPVPVKLPLSPDPGVDFGSVAQNPNFASSLARNNMITRLSSTLYAVCGVPAAATSVVCYAVSYVHATDAWTWGSPVTVFSSANTWTMTGVVGLNSTTYAVLAWEATAAKQSARAATVSGVVITQGTTIQSGAGWGANPTSADSATYAALTADSASTFFYASRYDGTHLGVTHFSVSGTTLTADGGGAFGSSSVGTAYPAMCSTAANTLDTVIASDGAAYGVSRYTYSAGSVTNTFNRRSKSSFGSSVGIGLHCVDTTNHVYFATGAGNKQVSRYVLNGGATDLSAEDDFFGPAYSYNGGTLFPSDDQMLFFTENEGMVSMSSGYNSISLFDPTTALRARFQENGAAGTAEATNHIARAPMLNFYAKRIQGIDVNISIRRMAIVERYQSQSVAADRAWAMQMYDLPHNYDAATQ